MTNIREGNIRVYYLEREIAETIVNLRAKPVTPRIERQVADGEKFLEMIKHNPYNRCTTVKTLIKKISEVRNKLKKELVSMDIESNGHQMTIFEIMDERTEEEKKKHALKVEKLKEEIHWLHKCLGICKNADYFN